MPARSLPVGAKIKFASERRRYMVRASNERFAVCTKPFNILGCTIYTIVDQVEDVRGRENLIFCLGFITDEQCAAALQRLVSGESAVSHRHYIPLDIERVDIQ